MCSEKQGVGRGQWRHMVLWRSQRTERGKGARSFLPTPAQGSGPLGTSSPIRTSYIEELGWGETGSERKEESQRPVCSRTMSGGLAQVGIDRKLLAFCSAELKVRIGRIGAVLKRSVNLCGHLCVIGHPQKGEK